MKIVCYEELNDRYRQPWSGQLDELERIALLGLAEYCKTNEDKMYAHQALIRQLSYVVSLFEGNVEGKTILDLGCGSNDYQLESCTFQKPHKQFEPWLCRALQILGAKVIGVDYTGLWGEKFTYYHANLADADCLVMLEDQSVDVANASSFFDSPFLNLRLGLDAEKVKQNLVMQLERVVKQEGTFVYDPHGLSTLFDVGQGM